MITSKHDPTHHKSPSNFTETFVSGSRKGASGHFVTMNGGERCQNNTIQYSSSCDPANQLSIPWDPHSFISRFVKYVTEAHPNQPDGVACMSFQIVVFLAITSVLIIDSGINFTLLYCILIFQNTYNKAPAKSYL